MVWPSSSILSGAISLFFPITILDTFQLGVLIFRSHIFLPFILLMGFSWQEYWSGLLLPPPVDTFDQNIIMTCLSWIALHSMAPSITELHKPHHHHKAVIQGIYEY